MCQHCGIALADCEYHGPKAQGVEFKVDQKIAFDFSPDIAAIAESFARVLREIEKTYWASSMLFLGHGEMSADLYGTVRPEWASAKPDEEYEWVGTLPAESVYLVERIARDERRARLLPYDVREYFAGFAWLVLQFSASSTRLEVERIGEDKFRIAARAL